MDVIDAFFDDNTSIGQGRQSFLDEEEYRVFTIRQVKSACYLLAQVERAEKKMPNHCLWLGERYVELTGPPESVPPPAVGIHYPGQPITKEYLKSTLEMTACVVVAGAKISGICRPEEIGIFPLSHETEIQETAKRLAAGFVCQLYGMPPEDFTSSLMIGAE